ncbi:hypothetical protein EII34_14010 [Arachnia propionica]|uniref:GH16 domain-containing protein n=1 Tax=Arachnia propionica TaxID=1750 RepID=A0A3P1T220_9ACTN|nr:hypothetical protein [Arachnia propionica]MDO5082267.1 hypothetical protein [Arachnia propionica]RRD03512.1 hypothetical protein EII34_14010 [Arachnia propionica]
MTDESSHADLLRHRTYGGWSVQRPEHGTLGRYSPDMTRLVPDGVFELRLRLDRAAYQLYREAGVGHEQALHNALLCPSWAGLHSAAALGVWEMEIQAPPSDRVEMVAMLWPDDDQEWPSGEINLMEGRIGTGETMTNLHWADPLSGAPAHDPKMVPVDVTRPHRYAVEVGETTVCWYLDGTLQRRLETPHAPHTTRVHMVVQAGVHRSILDDWHPDLEWEQTILLRPLRAPG